MNTRQKLSVDWRIGFQKNVPRLIWIGIVIALVGVFFGPILTNIFSPDELVGTERTQTLGFTIFGLSRFIFFGGLALIIFGIFMYLITRNTEPSE